MDIIKWQNIIIEWINCLKLSKPVIIIDDLKDGECFKEILARLLKNEKNIPEKQTQISEFLKRHYPAFFLENESSQIQDSVEITYAYSLLLHYCSLVDCSEEFILPLCKDLNYMSQIFVKNFLEDLQLSSVITRDILKNAIYKMNKYASTPTKSITSSFSSPKTPNNTPLLEYLKTPHKKVNEELHKREVKQLQAQLDLERFEKADLQEELNVQYEKNKKLDKNISENQTEIRRLRAKLLSLENLTPPSNSKQDRNIENKRLRDEIVSLEKYVEILHKEQEELQTERDKARDKLRKMEENTNDWQTKCIQNEKQLLKQTEENKNHLQELLYLRERCEELSTMLHELNPRKCYDESYEADSTFSYDGAHNKSGSIVDSASLAQTVIDVQLVDAQTENKRLKTQLIEFEETTEKLTNQLNQLECEMTHLQDINKETTNLLADKTDETRTLNEKITNLEFTLDFTQKEKDNLIDELKLTTEMNKTFIEKLNLEIKNLNAISEQYESTNEMLKNKFDQFNCDVERCLEKFKRDLNYGETFPEDCDTIYKLTILIDTFEIKNTNNNKMITNLHEQYQTLLNQIVNLEKEISTLNTNEIKRKTEIDQLKCSLKTAENKIEHYEKEVVTNYENLIDKYKSIIEEKCGMISELTKLKDVLINKENTISKLQNENHETEKQKQQLEKSSSNLKCIINEKENFIKSLELEKTQLQQSYDNLSQNVTQLKTKLDDLQKENIEQKHNIDQLNADKNETESQKSKFEMLYNQTKQTLNEKILYMNDLNAQKHELENQIDGLTNQIKSLEDDLSQEKSTKDELNKQLQNEKTLKDELNNQFIVSKQNYESDTSQLCETIKQKTDEILSLQNEIHCLNENIAGINCEVYNIACMLSTENENVEMKEKTVESLEKHLQNLKNQLSLNLEEKQETIDELKNYKQQIDFYRNEFETYKLELENVFDEINTHLYEREQNPIENDEILVLLKEARHMEQQNNKKILGNMLEKILKLKENIYNIVYENHRVTSEMHTLQQQYDILDHLKQEIEDKLTATHEQSTNKITELNEQLQVLQEENHQYVTNLETYRENLNKAHETFAETQISVEGLIKKHKLESDNYRETISELKKKNTKLEEQIHHLKLTEQTLTDDLYTHQSKLKNVLEDYNTSVRLNEDIKHKKETLSKKLHKQTESFEELQTSLSKTNLELEASLREIEMFKSIKTEFEKSFNALNKDHESVVSNYETRIKKLKQENDELREESEELIKEMTKTKDKLNIEKIKQTEFDVRMKNFTHETEKLEEKIVTLKNKLTSTEDERQSLITMQEQLKNTTNQMIQETKQRHKEEKTKLQNEIDKLNGELEAFKMCNEQNETKKVALLETNQNLQKTIDDLNEDKNVLHLKVEQLNEDLIKLKSCNDEKYKEKLDEINDTKTKLSYTLDLIENIYKLLENELDKTTIELKQSDDETSIPEKLKTIIEQLIEKKKQLEINLDSMTIKISEIEQKTIEDKLYYTETNTKLKNEVKESLVKIQNENLQIINCLEKRLKKEQNTSKIYLKEVETLNTILIDKINEIEKITNDKENLIKEYKTIANKVSLLKKSRNELAEDHQKIIKEVEAYIVQTHESVNHIKRDFSKRLEEHKKERETNETLIKQLENYLQVEKNNVTFLENRIQHLTNDKQQLITFTSKCFTNIHEFYDKIFEKNDVTEQINKLKLNQSEIEDELQSINFEGEIVDKEIELINNELIELKKIRGEMQNYELVKSDYVTLKNKYNLMSVCETENNGYKLKISDLESKLSDLQNENVKYQKEITELQKEYNNVKGEHGKEINLMETSYATWKKIAEDKNKEIETLIEKYATEMKEVSESNIQLRKTIKQLEDKLYLNEEVIYQEKCKNEDLISTNIKLEKELDKQTQEKEKLLKEGKIDYDIMNQKYELLSTKQLPKLEDEILSLQEKIAKYKNIITELEHDNLNLNKNQTELKQQCKVILEQCEQSTDKEEVAKLRASYTNLMGENSRLQLDCTVLKKTIDERNTQLSELQFIKESYEKLLEDNNKSHMELDTLRYKRNRDKEEFKRLLEEERTKGTTNADTQITDIRNEYEEKLKKMKEKMVNLYKEEMEREKKRITLKLSQSEEIVQSLKSQLWVTGNKNVDLTKEIERLRDQLRAMKEKLQNFNCNEDFRGSRESMSSLKERRAVCDVEERRISTLPRDSRSFQRPQVNIIEETVTVSRKRRSITGGVSNLDQGLKMEDEEGELFNNTYLSDLKAGRCIESGRESVSSRLSELQYRNSLCPPHLKSSYPAETQFQSPGQFKEEELKMGTVDLDDSMSSSLLPGEKPRMKKDWGQTMYKKPGPPTPSKNGGRLSLQGNEVHPRDVLREQNENKPSGRTTSTPSRIKMLFSRSGATSSHRNDSEVGMKSPRSLQHSYEHSLVPLLTRPEPVRLNPQLIKVYHIPHTFGQAFRIYFNKDLFHAFLLMIASAFTTYIIILICE